MTATVASSDEALYVYKEDIDTRNPLTTRIAFGGVDPIPAIEDASRPVMLSIVILSSESTIRREEAPADPDPLTCRLCCFGCRSDDPPSATVDASVVVPAVDESILLRIKASIPPEDDLSHFALSLCGRHE